MLSFPDGFIWGVATAGHQIEGNNVFSDWYTWEHQGKVKNGDTSDIACGSWENLGRDIEAVKSLGVKAYRFSVEWARIEPKANRFEESALERYGNFCKALIENGVQPILTLNHFVLPQWFSDMGGWENRENLRYFRRFVSKIVQYMGRFIHYWVSVNEPNVYAVMSYLMGEWPPEIKDMSRAMKVLSNLLFAHGEAYDAIKEFFPTSMVGAAINMMPFFPLRKLHPGDRLVSNYLDRVYNYSYLDSLLKGKLVKPLGNGEAAPEISSKLDFIGINYYTRIFVKYSKPLPEIAVGNEFEKTEMGYEFFPQGIEDVILKAYKRYQLPIIITENGIADASDTRRWEYIEKALTGVRNAMEKGARVFGYMYWSLMDNFEWKEGYSMKFGLYETVQKTLELKPRGSVAKFRDFISKSLT